MRKKALFRSVLAAGVLALASLAAACGTDYHNLPRHTVEDVLKDYQDNEAAAAARYEEQRFILTGETDKIEAGGVALKTPALNFLTEARAGYRRAEDLQELRKGQTVRLVCTGDGYKTMGANVPSMLTGGEAEIRLNNELRFRDCFPLPPRREE